LSDPFVIITTPKTKAKTPVIKKTLNPTWNYFFEIVEDVAKWKARFQVRDEGNRAEKKIWRRIERGENR
jgi:Ca2+-dependent lipid-binding protein